MTVIPFVHTGLGNSSYLVELSDGEAALIDPDRTIDRYVKAAEARGWRISAVFETHLHADFVSGALEVSLAAGARVFLPAVARSRVPHHPLRPGERVALGDVEVEPVESSGHTPEHLSYVFRRGAGPPVLFSGGSLIVGGAARTDLVSPDLTEPLSRAQYRTLKTAFSSLPDETLLHPTHGGGSFCSTGASSERRSTLGKERRDNPLLLFEDEGEFARWFPTTFPGAPAYFFRMRAVNQAGPRLRRQIPLPRPLSPAEFDAARRTALVVDVRSAGEYAAGHIPGSLANPFRDSYATWLGWLVPPETPLLFATNGVPLERVIDESLLVGYERFAGWLAGGIAAWLEAGLPSHEIQSVGAAQARKALLDGVAFLDVREPGEFASGHIEGAIHIPLGELESRLDRLPRDRPITTYCGHGERSTTAASILERLGFPDVRNLSGGITAWREAGYGLS